VEEADLIRGDLRWGTTPTLVRAAAASHGDHPAVVDGDVTLTYAQLADEVTASAAAFVGAGIEPGDRVAIWAPNMWEWPVALLGLQSAGAALVPLNTRYKGAEAAYILDASRSRILLTVEGFLGNDYVSMLRQSGRELPHLERVVVLRGTPPEGALSCDDFLALGADVAPEAVDRRIAALGPDDISDLLFTSGTTGAPKGVICSHGQTLRASCDWASIGGLRSDDRYLVVNPFFHSFGYKAGIVASLCAGATIYPEPVFDVPKMMATIERERITTLPGPPTIYQSMLNHPDFDADRLSSLRLIVTGAAVVPVQLIEDLRDRLGVETILTANGQTEVTGYAATARRGDDPETISSFTGRAYPGVEIETRRDDGTRCDPMEPGEVMVRGYNVTRGYFEDPEKTAETIEPDGWLHTGDVGLLDERGYLRITDRKKDMFIVGGFKGYPAEIESLLLDHPAVAQAAVVGVTDERMGEVGFAFVIPAAGTAPDPDEIRAWAKGHMANYKVPARVAVVDALPQNASGKVLKYELRDRAAGEMVQGDAR
jgi:acyl-CoA synthetase (AMP-forming)/AMP-acid ligase II